MNRPEFEIFFKALIGVEKIAYADKDFEKLEILVDPTEKPFAYNWEKAVDETHAALFKLDDNGRHAYVTNILLKMRPAVDILNILFDENDKMRQPFQDEYAQRPDLIFYLMIANEKLNQFAYNMWLMCNEFRISDVANESYVLKTALAHIIDFPDNAEKENELTFEDIFKSDAAKQKCEELMEFLEVTIKGKLNNLTERKAGRVGAVIMACSKLFRDGLTEAQLLAAFNKRLGTNYKRFDKNGKDYKYYLTRAKQDFDLKL